MNDCFVRPGDDLQAVFDRAEPGSHIHLAAGIYRQKLMLRTPGLTITGAGAERTVLVWDDWARKLDRYGLEYNTFRTWTLAVCAEKVTMRDLAVVNDALNPAERGQEIALTVYGDGFTMEDCVLRSTQDTLFSGPLPPDLIDRYFGFLPDELRRGEPLNQQFTRCRIEGTVDFIFGSGTARFDECELRSVYDRRGIGYVAAPSHSRNQTEGFTFSRCRFTAEETVAAGSVYLARPWRDYGLCRFENCTYGPHIAPAGFDPWQDSGRERTARFYERPTVEGRTAWAKSES